MTSTTDKLARLRSFAEAYTAGLIANSSGHFDAEDYRFQFSVFSPQIPQR